eukprot:gb/GECG01004467.1/.p1 GENE.gb/GECG01004467.1/~~gb/GECG01004467.1/.p1  ORF type:complete len:135 (+),score=14.22 gb/GECG01004467.1/:1-405(+)
MHASPWELIASHSYGLDSGRGSEMFHSEFEAHLPAEVLEQPAIAREVVFSSQEAMEEFWIKQRILLSDRCIEEWGFHFGFVIPQSTNSWEQIIERADKDSVLPKEILSGNLVVETNFYTGENLISKGYVRIYYD